jgi:uncharacterized protein (TIGR02594 family)
MRANKTTVRRKRPATKKRTKAAAMPQTADRRALHNRAVLVAAIITFAVFGGSAALPKLFDPADPMAQRIDDAAFARTIAGALAEGHSAETHPPLFIVKATEAAVTRKLDRAVESPRVRSAEPLYIVASTGAAVSRAMTRFGERSKARLTPEIKIDFTAEAKAAARAKKAHRRQAAVHKHAKKASKEAEGLQALASVPGGHELIAEARKYLGRNPTGWANNWCGKFLDMVLKRTGHKGGGASARGYIKYGARLPGPEIGAIAVFSRKGGGHVGIVTGVDSNGNPIIISGNHNDRVAIATYPASRLLAYVRP